MTTSAQYQASLEWDRDINKWIDSLSVDLLALFETQIAQVMQFYAPKIEAWMKAYAPWKDQTGNARQALHAEVEALVRDSYSIVLTSGMPYGYWLELKYQGRYAIIQPALDYWFPIVIAEVRRIME